MFDNVPDYIELHAEISVYQFIAGSRYITPPDCRFAHFQFAAEVSDRLADNFNLSNDRALDHLISEEHRATAGSESLDQRDSLKNMLEIKFVAPAHRGLASARMRALSFG